MLLEGCLLLLMAWEERNSIPSRHHRQDLAFSQRQCTLKQETLLERNLSIHKKMKFSWSRTVGDFQIWRVISSALPAITLLELEKQVDESWNGAGQAAEVGLRCHDTVNGPFRWEWAPQVFLGWLWCLSDQVEQQNQEVAIADFSHDTTMWVEHFWMTFGV